MALIAVGAAFLFYLMIGYLTGHSLPPYITFYPAVMIVALAGGLGPGLACHRRGRPCRGLFYPSAEVAVRGSNTADVIGLILFSGMGVLMSVVAQLYRRLRAGWKRR